jgi:hypothetical protein
MNIVTADDSGSSLKEPNHDKPMNIETKPYYLDKEKALTQTSKAIQNLTLSLTKR